MQLSPKEGKVSELLAVEADDSDASDQAEEGLVMLAANLALAESNHGFCNVASSGRAEIWVVGVLGGDTELAG